MDIIEKLKYIKSTVHINDASILQEAIEEIEKLRLLNNKTMFRFRTQEEIDKHNQEYFKNIDKQKAKKGVWKE